MAASEPKNIVLNKIITFLVRLYMTKWESIMRNTNQPFLRYGIILVSSFNTNMSHVTCVLIIFIKNPKLTSVLIFGSITICRSGLTMNLLNMKCLNWSGNKDLVIFGLHPKINTQFSPINQEHASNIHCQPHEPLPLESKDSSNTDIFSK